MFFLLGVLHGVSTKFCKRPYLRLILHPFGGCVAAGALHTPFFVSAELGG